MHEILEKLRAERGVSISEMARQLGFKSDTTVGRWLKGESEPKLSEAVKVAEYFGVGLDDLVGRATTKQRMSDLTEDQRTILTFISDAGMQRSDVVKLLLGRLRAENARESDQS